MPPDIAYRKRAPLASLFLSLRALRLRAVLPVVLGGVLLIYLATLRPGLGGGGDAAQYVMHAENLVEGRPYAETGYVGNPHQFIAPKSYPPGYPLLLVPVVALFGVNLMAMKVVGVVFFVAALFVIAWAFRRALSPVALGALVAVIGLHPFFWDFKDSLLSDLPFLLFAFGALAAYNEAHEWKDDARRSLLWALAAAACTGAAILTRSLGVVLLPSFVLYDVIRWRRLSRPLLVVGGLCALGGAAALVLAPSAGGGSSEMGYVDLVQDQMGRIKARLLGLPQRIDEVAHHAGLLWDNGYVPALRKVLFGLSIPLLLLGFWDRLRRQFSVFEVFAVLYVAALMPWTFLWLRYLMPLFPLYFFYLFVGSRWLMESRWLEARAAGAARALALAGLLALAGTYAAKYSTLDPERVGTQMTTPAAEELYAYIRQHTEPDDLLLSERSRQVIFFTGRPTSTAHEEDNEATLLRFFRSVGADYMIVGPPHPTPEWEVSKGQVERFPEHFERVYGNDEFGLYRIRLSKAARQPQRAPAAIAP